MRGQQDLQNNKQNIQQNKKKINPSQKAVALKYDPADIAPSVIAKGKGYIAEKILDKGKDEDIPVFQDEKLVNELLKIDLGDSIPPELYEVVAQVLIFISELDRGAKPDY